MQADTVSISLLKRGLLGIAHLHEGIVFVDIVHQVMKMQGRYEER